MIIQEPSYPLFIDVEIGGAVIVVVRILIHLESRTAHLDEIVHRPTAFRVVIRKRPGRVARRGSGITVIVGMAIVLIDLGASGNGFGRNRRTRGKVVVNGEPGKSDRSQANDDACPTGDPQREFPKLFPKSHIVRASLGEYAH